MTDSKSLDIISRLPGCARQAADAVSAYTQVKMEDAHKLLIIPKSECPDIWIRQEMIHDGSGQPDDANSSEVAGSGKQ